MKPTSLFILKITTLNFLIFFSSSIQAQVIKKTNEIIIDKEGFVPLPNQIKQHKFNFKGFSTVLNDDVSDDSGNHLLVGHISAFEKSEENRDSIINKLFDLKGVVYDDNMGIIITTDKDYNILKIRKSFIGKKIIYNSKTKQFTIGANFFDYIHVGDKSFSAWQPVIIETDIELKSYIYFVQKPYSCILVNMIIEKDKIIIFTRSGNNQTGEKNSEKAEVISVNTSKYHKDTTRTWLQVLDILSNLETPYSDAGRMTVSDVSETDNTYYFTTSNLNQFTLKNINHLYKLKDEKLTELPNFPYYLYLNNHSDWVNINAFIVNPTYNYLFLTHIGASKKEITFTQTDTNFRALLSKKIPLSNYADFDEMLVLSNGDIIIVSVNETETWSYYLYNPKLELIKEINSTISRKYYPNKLKEITNNRIECIFYIDNVSKKDCLLQIVNPN